MEINYDVNHEKINYIHGCRLNYRESIVFGHDENQYENLEKCENINLHFYKVHKNKKRPLNTKTEK